MSLAASTGPEGARRLVTTRELERLLGGILAEAGETLRVRERRPMPTRSTFPVEELRVRRGDRADEWVVWKDLSHDGPDDPVWRVKPAFLHDPGREIATYRDVLEPARISAPRFRGALEDAARGRHWLLLDRVVGDPLWQRGERPVWERAARWLAELHTRFEGAAVDLPACLLRYDAPYYRRWLTRAARYVRWPEPWAREGRDFAWLAGRVLRAVAWLAAQPVTLLHGEFYPSNVLVEPTPEGRRVRPLDWEMAGIGSGLLDLAALTSGVWSEADARMLIRAYRSALPAARRPAAPELQEGLVRCRLLLAVQWLGWSREWIPPREHSHDWLGTAFELAAGLPE